LFDVDGWSNFNIKPKEFYDLMGRYLERKYDVDIEKVL